MVPPADRFARHPGQNSPSTHAHSPKPVQNSPNTHAHSPKPVQNSPNTAKIAHFGPFLARWAKNVTLKAQTPQAGRFFSHSWSPTYIGETNDTVSHPNMPPLKPLTPLRGSNQTSLKPRAPLQVETRPDSAIFHPQW
ncbi:hypothetical protein FBF35_03360 [Schaalia odontolytica]|uniref:hypothetical protein n=1 Tax=Schaalia odontolytica TaxID=1660 RepID=UPI001038E007|nr:hypothetical protein [Schaalia odontolytica]QCT35139.1 hypothetical protein FBF35_03360 [Schaalia odontolytica]